MKTYILDIQGGTGPDGSFLVREEKEDDNRIVWYVGPPDQHLCVHMVYDNEYEPDTLVLHGVAYSPKCNIEQNLQRKEGTAKMVMGALIYIKSKYKDIRFITLTDNSYIPCGHHKVYLINRNMLLYGMSWYEQYCKAILKHAHEAKQWEHARQVLTGPLHVSWKEFKKTLPGYVHKQVIKQIFRSSAKWTVFFNNLYAYQCSLFANQNCLIQWCYLLGIVVPHRIDKWTITRAALRDVQRTGLRVVKKKYEGGQRGGGRKWFAHFSESVWSRMGAYVE